MKLTDRQIRSLKADAKDQFYADGEGLYLRVSKSGTKTFHYRKQAAGKNAWVKLGTYPETSLLQARTLLTQLTSGNELATVESVYKLFRKVVLCKYKRPEISESRFALDILPKLGNKAVALVTKRDITNVLQGILDRGSPVSANRTLADLKHFFQFAWERGYIETNPSDGVTRKAIGGKEAPRDRALSWEEIGSFLATLRVCGMDIGTKAALYLCLLTGQRASEVLEIMRTGSCDLATTKSGRVHKVHFSIQVRAVLKLLRGLPPPKDHRVLSHALRRISATFTPHDLRRTMATRLPDLGVMPHIIEKMLNHKMEGVMAVYNHAEYLPERQAAWSLWGYELAKKRRASKS